MQKYSDTIADKKGNVIPGLQILVKTGAGAVAEIFSSSIGAAKSNPFFTDDLGSFEFYAENGLYKIEISSGSTLVRVVEGIEIFEPGKAAFISAADYGKTGGDTIANLVDITPDVDGVYYSSVSFYNNWIAVSLLPQGGGLFMWSKSTPKSQHNGGTIISPTVPWDGSKATVVNFLNKVGETELSGFGCWVRVDTRNLTVEMFGAVSDWDGTTGTDCGPIFQKTIDAAFIHASDVLAQYRYFIGTPVIVFGGVVLHSGLSNTFAKNFSGAGNNDAEQDYSARNGTLIIDTSLTDVGALVRTAATTAGSTKVFPTQNLPGRMLGLYVEGDNIEKHTFLFTSVNNPLQFELTKPALTTNPAAQLTFKYQKGFLRIAQGSAIEGFTCIRAGLNTPYYQFNTSPVEAQAQQDAYFGCPVFVTPDTRFPETNRRRTARDVRVENMLMLGFGQGLLVGQAPRPRIYDVKGDCINGIFLGDIGDVGRVRSAHFWPFLNIKSGYANGVGLKVGLGAAQLRVYDCFMRGFQVCYECNASNVDFHQCSFEGATGDLTGAYVEGAIGYLFRGDEILPNKVLGGITQTCDYAIVLDAKPEDPTKPNSGDRRILRVSDLTCQTAFKSYFQIKSGTALITGNLFAPALGVQEAIEVTAIEVQEGIGTVKVFGNYFKNMNNCFSVAPGFEKRLVQFGNEFDNAIENYDSKYQNYLGSGFGVDRKTGDIYPATRNQSLGRPADFWDGLWCKSISGYEVRKIVIDDNGAVVTFKTQNLVPLTNIEFFKGNYEGVVSPSSVVDFQLNEYRVV